MQASEIAERAAEIVQERGLAKGALEDRETGAVCAVGALLIATYGSTDSWWWKKGPYEHVLTEVREDLRTEVGTLIGKQLSITTWNNAPERTAEDVILELKHSAARLREKEEHNEGIPV